MMESKTDNVPDEEEDAEKTPSIMGEVSIPESEMEILSKEAKHLEEVSTETVPSDSKNELSNKDSSSVKENQNNGIDEANLHYENGTCIYTEPESKCQFVWDEGKQEWIPRSTPDIFPEKDYEYDGKSYTYTDKETNTKYIWSEDLKEWKVVDSVNKPDENPKENEDKEVEQEAKETNEKKNPTEISRQDMSQGSYSFENDTHIYTDPSDGAKYFWDKEKNAWFPKVDDDFLAQYQMSYGFVDPNANDPKAEDKIEESLQQKEADSLKRKAPQEPAWFNVGEETTKVYVSGLPLDITEAEFIEIMQKCGLVMRDTDTGKMKVKIYLDPEKLLPKGDALCTYIKKESVDLALNLLDGSDVRGHRIQVQRAKFTMKGDYDPSLKPKKKRKKDKEKLKKIQEKLFDWRPDKLRGERSKHEKVVIVKNLFKPEIFDKDVKLILEYQQDLRDECLKCGAVKKVIIYDKHPEGVAQISFKEFEAADACIQLLNGRWFGQRKITAEVWDGKTKYKITETDEEIKTRLARWEKFLEAGDAEGKERSKEVSKVEVTESKPENETKAEIESTDCESDNQDTEKIQRDSDEDTRSSVGSDYDTDDETKTST